MNNQIDLILRISNLNIKANSVYFIINEFSSLNKIKNNKKENLT